MDNHTNLALDDFAQRWEVWADEGLPTSLRARLTVAGTFTDDDLATLECLADELDDLLGRHHPIGAIDRFIAAAPDHAGYCDRRATIGILELLTKIHGDPMPWAAPTHPDPNTRRRVLTGLEAALVRQRALATNATAALVGLLDSGAASGELPQLTIDDFTFDASSRVLEADLPGTGRATESGYPVAAPRRVEIAAWARPVLTKVIAATDAGHPLAYSGSATSASDIQSAQLMRVRKVLTVAGLGGDPTVKPLSIRNTFGRDHHDRTGDLLGTAALFGHEDLMSVAREIGLRPHPLRQERASKRLSGSSGA